MSSQLKIEFNRRNAQLSTGPKTPEGKAKVATNSRTHGLCSRNAILPEEDPDEFHALLAGLLAEFQPANAREESHVRELASAEWRLRRNTAPPHPRGAAPRLLGLAFRQYYSSEAFTKLTRYKNSIRRAYYKALKELKSPPPPRIAEMTKQSQTPEPPDPEPSPQLSDTVNPAAEGPQVEPPPTDLPPDAPPPLAASERGRSDARIDRIALVSLHGRILISRMATSSLLRLPPLRAA